MTIIVAYDQNKLIGMDGKLPWYEPEDMMHFRKITHKSTIIMGRKTWESLPNRPLKFRNNIILSKLNKYRLSTTGEYINHRLHGLDMIEPVFESSMIYHPKNYNCINIISNITHLNECYDITEKFIIGGESIYRLALENKYANKIIASEMKFKTDISGKNHCAYFPEFTYKIKTTLKTYNNFDVVEYIL